MGTRYQQGRDAEYRAIDDLALEGWAAERTAGSHGTADVIAWNDRLIRYIQIKTFRANKPPSYAKDLKQLQDLPVPPNGSTELWVRKVGQRGWLDKLIIQSPKELPA